MERDVPTPSTEVLQLADSARSLMRLDSRDAIDGAAGLWRRVETSAREHRDVALQTVAAVNFGICLQRLGYPDSALAQLRAATEIGRRGGDRFRFHRAEALRRLARAHLAAGQRDSAVLHLRAALDALGRHSDQRELREETLAELQRLVADSL
jgi:tetratricopeptide (TPR) repeat protein